MTPRRRRHRIVPAAACAAIATLGAVTAIGEAHAGPDSEVASAFDPDDGFDLNVTLDYGFELRRSIIERERVGLPGTEPTDPVPLVDDLAYQSARHVLVPRLELGLFHDVSASAALPIIITDTRHLELDDGVERATSSTIVDGILSDTGYDARDPTVGFTDPSDPIIFRGPDRHGLDQLHLGLTWAPMNQRRDDTKPTWKLGAEVRVAVGAAARLDRADPDSEVGVGNGVHEVRLWTSMARRMGWAEPYVEIWWQAPIGLASDSPFTDPGFGSRHSQLQQQAGTRFGFEAIAVDRPEDGQRVSLDFSARLDAHFEGRNYSEMWEVFAVAGDVDGGGPLVLDRDPLAAGDQAESHPGITNVENYLTLGGRFAVRAELGDKVHIAGFGELLTETSHVITFTDAGVDLPRCSGNSNDGCEDDNNDVVNPGTNEVDPTHVPVIDVVGHRFRSDEILGVTVGVEAKVLF